MKVELVSPLVGAPKAVISPSWAWRARMLMEGEPEPGHPGDDDQERFMMSDGLRHGVPEPSRNDKYAFDKYLWPSSPHWPGGLEIHIYDDGRVKVGSWHASAAVTDVSNYRKGGSNASAHVIACFQSAQAADRAEDG